MKYCSIVLFTILLTQNVLGEELSPEEKCTQRGAIAEQASKMRVAGVKKETTIETLVKKEKAKQSGVTEKLVKGAVNISYMARMKPEKMRDYYISQCKKDIIR
ncbi:MAG: hypothetical protein KZQ83_08915 [gamma proteobacterium symbiont of Taylorina sp.]|nr:hypothetical protein [gamma proteobacterium symbiont of Taylorina sp.]